MVPQTWYKSLNIPLQAQISKMGILIFLAIPLLNVVNPSQGAILPKSSKGEHLNFWTFFARHKELEIEYWEISLLWEGREWFNFGETYLMISKMVDF